MFIMFLLFKLNTGHYFGQYLKILTISAKAEITFPSVVKDLLILAPS